MKKRYIGLGLIGVAFLIITLTNLNSLSTFNLAILMGIGIIAWIGMSMLISTILHNPSGPDIKMWKMLLKGFLGFVSFFVIFMIGISNTHDHVTNELNEFGISTNAIVINKDFTKLPAKRGQVNYVYYLTIRFQDQNGKQQQLKSEVQEPQYANAQVNSSIRIKYSSRNIKIHQLDHR